MTTAARVWKWKVTYVDSTKEQMTREIVAPSAEDAITIFKAVMESDMATVFFGYRIMNVECSEL